MKKIILLLSALLLFLFGTAAGESATLPEWTQKLGEWWNAMAPVEEKEGIYTGDLFELASYKQSAALKWGDVALLIDMMEMGTVSEEKAPTELLSTVRQYLLTMAESYKDFTFEAEYFPEAGCASLTVFCPAGTVYTASCGKDRDGVTLVIGSAENGKTYYREYTAVPEEQENYRVHVRYLADDRNVGYPYLPEDALIVETDMTIMATPAELLKIIRNPSLPF